MLNHPGRNERLAGIGTTGHSGAGAGGEDAFAQYVDLLGAEQSARALETLEAALRGTFSGGGPVGNGDRSDLAGAAHRLISTATVVGFLELARACREFEESCGSGAERAAFERLRSISRPSLRAIGRLRAELRANGVP